MQAEMHLVEEERCRGSATSASSWVNEKYHQYFQVLPKKIKLENITEMLNTISKKITCSQIQFLLLFFLSQSFLTKEKFPIYIPKIWKSTHRRSSV